MASSILDFLEEVDRQGAAADAADAAAAAMTSELQESSADKPNKQDNEQQIERKPKREAAKRYDQWNTKVKAVEVNRLVWAPTLNYFRPKTGTSAVLFPGRIAENAEAACVQINVWPIPPGHVLVEFIDGMKKGAPCSSLFQPHKTNSCHPLAPSLTPFYTHTRPLCAQISCDEEISDKTF